MIIDRVGHALEGLAEFEETACLRGALSTGIPLPSRDREGAVTQRGSALLAVLWLSAALSAIAFAMSVTVREETDRAATSMDDLRSYYLASAAVEKATVELLWTATQGANLIPKDSAYINYDFPSGIAHVEIIPEAAKLNVNRVSQDDLFKLVSALGVDPPRAGVIATGILDWRSGAAGSSFDAYYLSMTPSFQAPHTSFQEIEELLSVRGVTPDIFYGTWAPAGNGAPATHALVRHAGLNDCLTVYGSLGGVDVNTAEPAVLAAVGVSPDVIAAIVARRAEGAANQNMLEFAQSLGAGAGLRAEGNAIVTFRATARLRLPNGQLSDMRRTVGAQVKFLPFGSERPYYSLRWYDTAWSY
jgi:general secretion pathway protein K